MEAYATTHAAAGSGSGMALTDYAHTQDEIWRLYEMAKQNQWNANTDINWDEPCPMSDTEAKLLRGILATYQIGEKVGIDAPARIMTQLPKEDLAAREFLATQCFEEARHCHAYRMRLRKLGLNPDTVQTGNSAWVKAISGCYAYEHPVQSVMSLNILGEVLAASQFTAHYEALCESGKDPVTRNILQRQLQDEGRHVAFGVTWLRERLKTHPEDTALARDVAKEWTPIYVDAMMHKADALKIFGIDKLASIEKALGAFQETLASMGISDAVI